MDKFIENNLSYLSDKIIRFCIRSYKYIWVDRSFDKNKELEIIEKIKNLDKVTYNTDKANKQHYEVPTDFFKLHLGKNLKYSSCEWTKDLGNDKKYKIMELNEAEEYTLKKYQEKMELSKLPTNSRILEIGCGWGSLSLYNARNFPHLNFDSFSNSETQIKYIKSKIREYNLNNLNVWKQDINEFVLMENKNKYDRIVTIECIEHCRNYKKLFRKMKNILNVEGFCFIHILATKGNSVILDNDSWMGRNFFTGGIIPSVNLFNYFNEDLGIVNEEIIPGCDYSKTLDAWLNNMYLNEKKIREVFDKDFDKEYQKWRLFYLMSSESFNYNNGVDMCVAYYIMK